VAQRALEYLPILELISKMIFELGEGMFLFVLHAVMLLRPRHHLPNPGEADMDLLSVGTRPVHPGAVAALAKPLGRFQNIGRDDDRNVGGGHLVERPVAITAARVLQIFRRRERVPVEDLGELRFENPRIHHLCFRPHRREFPVPGQQPAILLPRDAGEFGVLGFGPEVEAVIAAETKPPSQRPEHGVAEKAGLSDGGVRHFIVRIPHDACGARLE